ncbi:Aldehyde/histidinol dehydrogenase [Tuber indicum]|nr:Aldehyde/histidinol dehydrogenase [Tuber indicum]
MLHSSSAIKRLITVATTRLPSIRKANMSFKIPAIDNEPNAHAPPFKLYATSSSERKALTEAIQALRSKAPVSVPLRINAESVTTQSTVPQFIPSSHATTLASCSQASKEQVTTAISSALAAKPTWESAPFADRAAVFLKAAELIAGKYRPDIMAATILGQGKNTWQAEIDASTELVDFLRFNVLYAEELYKQQPAKNSPGVWNRVEYRPLEGFVYAISPFNFTAIGGNLPIVPALLGNVVIWKPSPAAIYSNYLIYQILLESGLPRNVIQFVPGDAVSVTDAVLSHKEFAALHYTGSTAVFRALYGKISQGVVEARFRSYPRIVGETGGKNFHLVHSSADIRNAVIQTIRGAFEYQGQKCSACSRLYIPRSISEDFLSQLKAETSELKVGAPDESFENFIGPVIHRGSFDKLKGVIDSAKSDPSLKLLVGGKYDDSKGFFIHPTIYVANFPDHKIFNDEFFGPILAVYVYPDEDFEGVMKTIDGSGGGYALTGSVFAKDRMVIRKAEDALRNSAGNFYINAKCTGAVVGQQPFGGARASGTNDKAGSMNILTRFVSARSIKEEFTPIDKVLYPSNDA